MQRGFVVVKFFRLDDFFNVDLGRYFMDDYLEELLDSQYLEPEEQESHPVDDGADPSLSH